MKCFVTGAAGFIGSHLCERLLGDGHQLVALDSFVPYYPRVIKESNLARARRRPACAFHDLDLRFDPLDRLLEGVEVVFHLAAMPGLSAICSDRDLYESCNVLATRRLLDAVRRVPTLRRFVYASTSSVYGEFACGDETLPTRPISPYGVSKLAAERLCLASAEEMGLPLVILRFFSVYGPRQRPDMGYYRFIRALLADEPLTVFGDGLQARGNTYIDDCIAATAAMLHASPGEIYNVGNNQAITVWDVIGRLEALLGVRAAIHRQPARAGDQRYTNADSGKIFRQVGWRPAISLEEGLSRQIDWQKTQPRTPAPG